jgi:hypothetical protein
MTARASSVGTPRSVRRADRLFGARRWPRAEQDPTLWTIRRRRGHTVEYPSVGYPRGVVGLQPDGVFEDACPVVAGTFTMVTRSNCRHRALHHINVLMMAGATPSSGAPSRAPIEVGGNETVVATHGSRLGHDAAVGAFSVSPVLSRLAEVGAHHCAVCAVAPPSLEVGVIGFSAVFLSVPCLQFNRCWPAARRDLAWETRTISQLVGMPAA